MWAVKRTDTHANFVIQIHAWITVFLSELYQLYTGPPNVNKTHFCEEIPGSRKLFT